MGPEGLVPTTARYGTALADIVRCRTCGHMQLDPMPPLAELESAVEEAYSEDLLTEAPGQRVSARAVLERLEVQRPVPAGRPRRLLDLGCWLGLLLDEARGRGWAATGVEPSERAAAFARETFGLDVRTAGVLEAELPPNA